MLQIDFQDKQVRFQGRNGYFRASGLFLENRVNDIVAISPITSRGFVGNCEVQLPKNKIPELIASLQKMI